MPKLRKRQHEDFCLAYAVHANAGEAALSAGYEYNNRFQQGYRLLRRPEIAARLQELREEIAQRECQSVAALLTKLESAFGTAIHDHNTLAAVRIIELQAKLSGHLARASAGHAPDHAAHNTPPEKSL